MRRMSGAALCSRRLLEALACVAVVTLCAVTSTAQTPEQFRDRLSRLPVDRVTASTISGQGEVEATLDGHTLTITATFEDVSSPATVAHLHHGPRARPGPVVFTIDAPPATNGEISDTITLTDPQREELRSGRYYLQIHTEGNPAGELRGWLLPQ